MRQRVESYGISKEDVDTIVKKVEEGHYQVSPALALQKRQDISVVICQFQTIET